MSAATQCLTWAFGANVARGGGAVQVVAPNISRQAVAMAAGIRDPSFAPFVVFLDGVWYRFQPASSSVVAIYFCAKMAALPAGGGFAPKLPGLHGAPGTVGDCGCGCNGAPGGCGGASSNDGEPVVTPQQYAAAQLHMRQYQGSPSNYSGPGPLGRVPGFLGAAPRAMTHAPRTASRSVGVIGSVKQGLHNLGILGDTTVTTTTPGATVTTAAPTTSTGTVVAIGAAAAVAGAGLAYVITRHHDRRARA